MRIIVIFVLYLAFLFSNQINNINTSNRMEITQLNKAFYDNGYKTINYWKEKYSYFYKRYKSDIINIIYTYTNLIDDIKYLKFKNIDDDKNKLQAQLSVLIRKSRDIALQNKDIALLISFLQNNDLYTITVSRYINKQCGALDTKYKINRCLQAINDFKNDPNYNNKDLLLIYQEVIAKIQQQLKALNLLEKEKCFSNRIGNTIEELENVKKCLLKKREKLLNLNKIYKITITEVNLTFLVNKYNKINNDIKYRFEEINSRLNALQKEKSDNLKFWISVILSIIMGFVALIIAKRSGINLNETVIIEHTKSDKRFKKGYRVERTTRTTKGLQIFGYTVIISFFILYFLLF